MRLGDTASYKPHPDDEGVDRIEIVAVPRYKTSGLSGDEWRMSAVVRFYRKGKLVGERGFSKMEYAAAYVPSLMASVSEWCDGPLWGLNASQCHQFSCAEPATNVVRLKAEYSARGEGPLPKGSFEQRRAFCDTHKTRGDCGLEDADINHEVVSAETILSEMAKNIG